MGLEILEFLRNRLGWIIILIGSTLLFSSILQINDLKILKFTLHENPSFYGIGSGTFLVLIGTILSLFSDKLSLSISLKGRWVYEVNDAIGKLAHRGECEVRQNGNIIKTQGTRKITTECNGTDMQECSAIIPWATDWARICKDKILRFDYHISLPLEQLTAICRVHIPDERKPTNRNVWKLLYASAIQSRDS